MIRVFRKLAIKRLAWRQFRFTSLLLVLIIAGAGTDVAYAQQDELPEGVVPPPLSVLSEDESESLENQTDLKRRTKLAISFMESRLALSESSSQNADYQESLDQLGFFRALMNTTLRDLDRNDYRKGVLKQYKRFEIALREFLPRIEVVRRSLPLSHSYHVSGLIKSLREVRRKSIEPFYSDTVLPDGESK